MIYTWDPMYMLLWVLQKSADHYIFFGCSALKFLQSRVRYIISAGYFSPDWIYSWCWNQNILRELGQYYGCWWLVPCRAGVKYVLSNTNTNTNTFFSGVSNTNTNTNTPAKIWSNTNTNTNTAHQIQIQIHNEAKTKLPPFWRWPIQIHCIVRRLFYLFKFYWKLFPKFQSTIRPALVHIMAWHWVGNKPLSDQWWPGLLMHKCITRVE